MKNYFKIFIMVFFSLLTLCSCKRIDENSLESTVSVTTTSVTSNYDLDEVTVSEVEDDTHSLVESSEHIVYLKDILSELPNFDTSYLDAELPFDISYNLWSYNECYLEITDNSTLIFDRSPENPGSISYITTFYYDGYTFVEPKLYYDNGHIYILAKELRSGHLFKILLEHSYVHPHDTFLYVDILNLEKTNVVSYFFKQNATFVQKDDYTYAFYSFGREICDLDINAKPEDIIFNKPFLDNSNNLIYIDFDDLHGFISYYVDTDVCTLYDYTFINPIGLSFVYEKNNGKSYLLSYSDHTYPANIQIDEIESSDFLSEFQFILDEFNRVFIYPSCRSLRPYRLIEIEIDGKPEIFSVRSEEYVCNIPVEKLDEYKLNELLGPTFSYSEKNSRIEKLLSYIN